MRKTRVCLSDEEVKELRERYCAGGTPQEVLAAEFGVSQMCVSALVRGKARLEAGGPIRPCKVVQENKRKGVGGKLSPAQARSIRKAFAQGASQTELAKKYGVSNASIQDVLTFRNFKYA